MSATSDSPKTPFAIGLSVRRKPRMSATSDSPINSSALASSAKRNPPRNTRPALLKLKSTSIISARPRPRRSAESEGRGIEIEQELHTDPDTSQDSPPLHAVD